MYPKDAGLRMIQHVVIQEGKRYHGKPILPVGDLMEEL